MADNQRYILDEVVGGMGGFGLLAGLAIGNIHGFLEVYRKRRSPMEVTALSSAPISCPQASSDENPYAPSKESA